MTSDLPPSPAAPESSAVPPSRPLLRTLVKPFWNADERRLRAAWRLAVLMAVLVLLSLGLSALVRPLLGPSEARVPRMALTRSLGVLVVLAAVALVARFIDRRPLRDFGLRLDRAFWLDTGFGFGLGALLMALIFAFELSLGWITPGLALAPSAGALAWGLGVPLGLFVSVSITEEVLFRGYPLRTLAEGLRSRYVGPGAALVLAALLTSSLFGLAHAGNPNATWVSTLNITVAGLYLASGYVLTGRLAIPLGLHVSWNYVQGSVCGFPVSGYVLPGFSLLHLEQGGPELWTGGSFGPEAGLLGFLAMVLGTLLIVAWVRWRDGRVAFHAALADPPAPRPNVP